MAGIASRDDAAYRYIRYEQDREHLPFVPNKRTRANAVLALSVTVAQALLWLAQSQTLLAALFGFMAFSCGVAIARRRPDVDVRAGRLPFRNALGVSVESIDLDDVVEVEPTDDGRLQLHADDDKIKRIDTRRFPSPRGTDLLVDRVQIELEHRTNTRAT